eukprot:3937539-Ditylum_brightwellii.AAC.1
MSYLCNRSYPENHEFSTHDLERLIPHDIYQWMIFKVHRTDDPAPDNNLTVGHSSSLKYYKKAISYYIPNCRMQWNEISKVGNPTRSEDVNDLVQAVTVKEVRKQSRSSRADHGFEQTEMEQAFLIFQPFHYFPTKRKFSAMFKFQFYLIARFDNTKHVKQENLTHCFQFPFALLIQIH